MSSLKVLKICSRGHRFYKSRDCPVCPKCWPGFYKKKARSDFPDGLSAPALRALHNAKIKKLSDFRKWTEGEIGKLHGMGPKGIRTLRAALRKQKLSFKKS